MPTENELKEIKIRGFENELVRIEVFQRTEKIPTFEEVRNGSKDVIDYNKVNIYYGILRCQRYKDPYKKINVTDVILELIKPEGKIKNIYLWTSQIKKIEKCDLVIKKHSDYSPKLLCDFSTDDLLEEVKRRTKI